MKKSFQQTGTICAVLAALCCFSCETSAPPAARNSIERTAHAEDYSQARILLEERKSSLYADTDDVLYNLDAGLLSHYAGNYENSNRELAEAERCISDYFTQNAAQITASYLVNDYMINYAGEDYEDIYTNFFMALNYIHTGEIDKAFVEIRRFDTKQKSLSTKYSNVIAAAQKQADLTNYPGPQASQFYNSALTRYLSLLMYRASGKLDEAAVDQKLIQQAFATQAKLYEFPIPATISGEFSIPENKARLNVISFTGRSPRKVPETIRIPFRETYIKLALPHMVCKPSMVDSIDIVIKGVGKASMEKIENIDSIALDTFQANKSLIYLRSYIRATGKAATTAVLNTAAREMGKSSEPAPKSRKHGHSSSSKKQPERSKPITGDSQTDELVSVILTILDIGSRVYTEVSEQADTRCSLFFPGSAYVRGITIDPGSYDIEVRYYNTAGSLLRIKEYSSLDVKAGELNLIESYFLQ